MRIKILGKPTQEILLEITAVFSKYNKKIETVLFCDYAESDIPIDHVFNMITNVNNEPVFEGRMILNSVTQSYFVPFDQIPCGHKTICKFEFPEGIPECIESLPIINRWKFNEEAFWAID